MHDALKGPLKNTDALILDLRDGFGGRPYGFAEPFLRRSERRPLAVLINGGTRSAKEVLAHEFKKKGRGTLIGSTTAGHVLGTWPIRIADWAYLEIPMTEVKLDGVRLEGRGVDPDVEVPRESDASGRDLILEAAMVHLEGK
jgi:carboxyl-terminal processing protease